LLNREVSVAVIQEQGEVSAQERPAYLPEAKAAMVKTITSPKSEFPSRRLLEHLRRQGVLKAVAPSDYHWTARPAADPPGVSGGRVDDIYFAVPLKRPNSTCDEVREQKQP
jgi:hypothetical protein